MRQCPREEVLDAAAMRLHLAGIDPSAVARLPVQLLELEQLLMHTRGCTRCRELLQLLYDAERLRVAGAADESFAGTGNNVRGSTGRVLPLLPLGPIGTEAGTASDPIDAQPDLESFPAAADSPGAHLPTGSADAGSMVLTLATADQSYIVRIFANQGGPGATAILVGTDAESSVPESGVSSDRASAPQRSASPPRVLLRVSGVQYDFGPDGVVRLPEFPLTQISLILA